MFASICLSRWFGLEFTLNIFSFALLKISIYEFEKQVCPIYVHYGEHGEEEC